MDDIDRAQEREALDLSIALAKRKPAGPEATGECLECGIKLPEGQRWCGCECRNWWEQRQ